MQRARASVSATATEESQCVLVEPPALPDSSVVVKSEEPSSQPADIDIDASAVTATAVTDGACIYC